MRKTYLLVITLMMASFVNAQVNYFSKAASTDFTDVNSWGTNADGSGASPASITNADNYAIQNGSVMNLNSGNASVRTLTINAGTLNVSVNTLNVGIAGQKNSTLTLALSTSVLNVSGGTINIDGALVVGTTSISPVFSQTGGNINIDGNNGGSATNSYASTALCYLAGTASTLNLTGGIITIIDPPAGATYAFYGYCNTAVNFGTGHTIRFGDGISNDAGTNTNGFYVSTFPGSSYMQFGNVQLLSAPSPAANRFVSNLYTITALGDMTIGTNAELRQIATSYSIYIAGNLTNNGTFTSTAGTAPIYFGSYLNATAQASTVPQTISGSGVFRNNTTSSSSTANFIGLTFNNTSSGGVTFSNANSLLCITGGVTNTGTVSGTLTFTTCPAGVNLAGGTFVQGVSTASTGSLSWTSGGFRNGSFKKWLGTTTLPTTLPNTTIGNFPFTSGGANRNFQIAASPAVTAGGSITVSHNAANGLAVVAGNDPGGAYAFDRLTNASWAVSSGDGLTGGTFLTNAASDGLMLLTAITNEPRLVQNASSGVGTHVAPTGSTSSPVGNRSAISLANLTNSFSLGINNSNTPAGTVFSVQTGNWEDGTTWNTGVAPLSTDAVTVMAGHTVTVNANPGVASTVIVNGTLTVSGSTLDVTATATGTGVTMGTAGNVNINGGAMTVGTGANRFSTFATGTAITSVLNVSSGSLNVNGNLNIQSPSTFIQSGGTINVDGNATSVAANSVPSGTAIVNIASANLNLTGGTLIVVDPHANTTSPSATNNRAFAYNNGSNYNAGISHTVQFGDGSSTDAGGFTSGFVLNTFVGAGRLAFGNLIVNGSATGTNRLVTAASSLGILANLTTSGVTGEFSLGGLQVNVAGNVTNNGILTALAGGSLAFQNFLSGTATAAITAQTVSGSGTFRNLATAATANFNSITINNTSSTGVTFSGAQWNAIANGTVSGTLTFTAGQLNTSGSTLTLGISGVAAGTLTHVAGGFSAGSQFQRWLTTTAVTIGTAGGQFPFVTATNQVRHAFFGGVAAITAGWLKVQYNDVAGTTSVSIADLYPIGSRSNSNWIVTTGGGLAITANDAQMRFRGDGIFTLGSPASFLAVAATAVANGTSIGGTGTGAAPEANKTALTTVGLAQTIYVGIPNIINSAVAGGAWENGTSWVGGIVPGCNDISNIVSGSTITVNAAAANAAFVTVASGGTLTVLGNLLTVGCTNNNASLLNNGTLNVTGGNILVNGNLAINNASSFTHSAGTITIDGNNNSGVTGNTNSVSSGTPLFSIGTSAAAYSATGTITLSGGTIIIVDPHAGSATNTNTYSVYANMASTVFANASTSHTFQFGDGVSTGAGSNASGFYVAPFIGSGRLNFGNVTLNSAAGTNRNVVQVGTTVINGNLTGTLGTYDQAALTTNIGGNINIGSGSSFLTGGTVAFASVTGTTTSAQTVAQSVSVSGTGTISNLSASPTANFTTLTINNTSVSGVTFNALNNNSGAAGFTGASASATITFTGAGRATTIGTNALLWGTAIARGTGSLTPNTGGMTAGSTFAIGTTAAQTGTTFTAATEPGLTSAGTYPFIDAAGNRRAAWIGRVTPTGTGIVAVKYTDVAGTSAVSIVDATPAYTVNSQYNSNWAVSTYGTTPAAASFNMGISAVNAFGGSLSANYPRITTLSGVVATNQAGTTLPHGQRTGLTLANLTAQPFYVGVNSADIPFISVANGNWEDGTTWNKNPLVPTAADAVIISNATNVSVNAVPAVASNVIVSTGGTLTIAANTLTTTTTLTNNGTVDVTGGTLTTTTSLINNASSIISVASGAVLVTTTLTNNGTYNARGGTTTVTAASGTGITNAVTTGAFNVSGGIVNLGVTDNTACNRLFTNNGTLTVSSGTLNIYGRLLVSLLSAFNQSGGDINVDGNAAGNAANSIASGTAIVDLNPSNLTSINLTGGTLTLVDPHANSTASNTLLLTGATNGAVNVTSGHTIRFGNGVSTDAGGNAINGFRVNTWASTTGIPFGNVIVEGPAGTNRSVTGAFQQPVLGNLTVNSGGEFAIVVTYINGNILVNTGGIYTSTSGLSMTNSTFVDGSSVSFSPSTNAQTIGGGGTYRNLSAAPTANLTGLTINNNNATGITLNTPLSLSGTLIMTAGLINTTSTNLLTLGTATTAGTLSGTPSPTNMIVGPFARTFAASRTATGTYSNTTLYPVGKGAAYLPIHIDPSTTAGGAVIMSGEAFTSNAGTQGSGVTSLSTNRWEALVTTGNANLSNSFIRLNDAAIVSSNKILQSSSAAGSYVGIPVASAYAAGTPNTLTTSSSIPTASYLGYLAYGDLTNCVAPGNQPTVFGSSNLSTTSFSGSFTLATSSPSHYLVVRYPSGGTTTAPVDFTSYTVGGPLGAGTIVANVVAPSATYNATGLTAGTTYDIYIYSYNNSGCFGPVYNNVSPLTGSVTTCASATGAPGTPTSSLVTTNSFTATWAASSTPSVTYELDVATDIGFTTFVSGFNALNVGSVLTYNVTGLAANTTYYTRVRAVITGCYSTYSGTLTVLTECAVFTPAYLENFTTYVPSCWKEQTGYLTVSPSGLTGTSNLWTSDGWLNVGTTGAAKINLYDLGKRDWLISPSINLGVSGNYQLEFDLATLTFGGTSAAALGSDDSLAVVISTDNGATWSTTNILTVWTASNTPVPATGLHVTIPLTSYTGTVKFGFYGSEGIINDAPDVDVMIDNFAINVQPACTIPSSVSVGSITSTTASVSFTSAGSSFIVEYGATGFTPGTGAAAGAGGTIVTGGGSPIIISPLVAGNTYDVYVRQVCLGPIYSANSGPAVNFTTPLIVNSFPYCQGFESGAGGWSSGGTANDWVIGTPAKTQITGAHAGTNAYVTKTTGNYNDNENAFVRSPVFDFSALTIDPKLSFWSNFKTETGFDACIVEFTTDAGTTWTKLDATLGTGGTFNTTNSTNWYNSTSTNGPIAPPKWSNTSTAYTGNTAGWINSTSNLVGFKGAGYSNVQFRWRFGSDVSDNDEGWAIDDICVTNVDDVQPVITYTALNTTSCTTNRNLSVIITDGGIGVETGAGIKPRLYFKKSTDANTFVGNTSADNGWKFVETSSMSSPFSFTTDYSKLQSAIASNDIIQYFVTAQDMAATANVGINSGTFSATPVSVGLTLAAFPIGGTINQYLIGSSFSTDVTIGAAVDGGVYPTLSGTGGFFEALNSGTLNANINALIVSTSIAEPGTIALNAIVYGGCAPAGPFTLTIKPNIGVTANLTGANATGAIIKLNGADNVIIDGSNNGSNSRDLTINNTATGAVVWIGTDAVAGATNNTLKNFNMVGSGAFGGQGIIAGSGATFGNAAENGRPNSNNIVQNLTAKSVQNGIFALGDPTTLDNNWLITQNEFGSSVIAEKLSFRGITLQNAQNFTISLNKVIGVSSSAATTATMSGILVGATINGGTITRNEIRDIKQNNTAGYGSNGIYLNSSSATANLIVSNNFISDIASQGDVGQNQNDNGFGIMVNAGGGYGIYHNTVLMNTEQVLTGSQTAAINIESAVVAASVNIRNNIFVNTQTVGTNYAIINQGTNAVFAAINYNDYVSSENIGYQTTDQVTLSNWQTATTQDANSISVAPVFVSATDLHLVPAVNCAINATGTPIASVTIDIDGNTRDITNPDLGADEFILVAPAVITWTGAVNTDWNNVGNWGACEGIPTITSEVVIPTGRPNYPVINTNVEIKKITVDPSASVNVTTGFELKLNGF